MSDNFILRGGQGISLKDGILRLAAPVQGKRFVAVFSGNGTFTLALPTPLECAEFEQQTSNTLHHGSYLFTFKRAVFWSQDSLFSELTDGIPLSDQDVDRKEEEALDRSLKYATDKVNENVLFHLITERLEHNPQPYLFAHFFLMDGKEIFLTYDPRRFEEIAVYKPPYEAITGSVFWLQLINSFHTLEEYSKANEYELATEQKQRYDFISNTVDLTVQKGGKTTGTALLYGRALQPEHSTLTFLLDPTLVVDSIIDINGQKLPFQRNDKSWAGIIAFPSQDSVDFHLKFYYEGDFLNPLRNYKIKTGNRYFTTSRVSGSIYQPSSPTGWYPQQEYLDPMTFDVTYRIPDDMSLVAAGKKISDTSENGINISHYLSTQPSIICSFSLGFYKATSYRFDNDSLPIILYDIAGGEPEKVAADLGNSMRLFTSLFGKTNYAELKVAAGPMYHGQAFDEFIHLPWFDELVGQKDEAVSIGRAHEVAHAWWGHGVGRKSYHDTWLSEGFAEYSAALYAQFVLKKDGPFLDKLKQWKEQIVTTGKYALGSGPPLKSIWLGYRASAIQHRDDYSLSIYKKGAWVLHMLRMMMLNLVDLNEDAFKSMMQDYYQSYRCTMASTDDFRKIAEKHTHTDLHWFFDQWVYGAEIPTLKCSQQIGKTPTGKYAVTLTIEQHDVTKPFIILLPIEITYRNGTTARARLQVDQLKKEFTYEVDQEPEKVSFNIFESVLCNIEE